MPSIVKVPFPLKEPVFPLRALQDWYELNTFLNYKTLHKSFPISNGFESNHFGVIQAAFRKQAPKLEASKLNTKKEINWFTSRLPLKSDSSVLDLNCGTGIVSREIASSVKEVVGTDISRHLIEFAKTKAKDNVSFTKAEASFLPFEDSLFDVVFSRQSFTHFAHRTEVLEEMRRVCKPGGFICLMERVVPEELDEETAIRMEFLEGVRDASHVYFLTPAELANMFNSNNIEITLKETHACSEPYEDYLKQTDVVAKDRNCISQFIYGNMISPDPDHGQLTGFYPHLVDEIVYITHHYAMIGGINPTEKPVKKE